MIIKFNGVESQPYQNLNPEHREEILKFVDLNNLASIVNYNDNNKVAISEYNKIPTLIHLSSLTDLSFYVLPKSKSNAPGNTENICIGLYVKDMISTTIIPNIILDDPDNTRTLVATSSRFNEFVKDKCFEILSRKVKTDEERRQMVIDRMLLTYLKHGFEFNVDNSSPGYANLQIVYNPTKEMVLDRTFTTFE